MAENKALHNRNKKGAWVWQLGILVPEGQPVEYPVCPFCTTSPYQEPELPIPAECPTCGAILKLDDMPFVSEKGE